MSYQLKKSIHIGIPPDDSDGRRHRLDCGLIGYAMQKRDRGRGRGRGRPCDHRGRPGPSSRPCWGPWALRRRGSVPARSEPLGGGDEPAHEAVSVLLLAYFYMILMDALILVIAVLYNAFAGVVGLGGVGLELEGAPDEEPAS